MKMKDLLELELSGDSFFDKFYILSMLEREAANTVLLSPAYIENTGIRFMRISYFHDAKIIEITHTEIYGKNCLVMRIDFKGSATEFKKGYRKFDICFVNAEYIEALERFKELHILSLDCVQQSQSLITDMELEYFTGLQEHHCTCKIMCSGIDVKPIIK